MAARRVVHSRGPRRKTFWVGPADQNYLNVVSAGAVIMGSLAQSVPLTVVRTRGQISVKPTAYITNLTISGAFGVGIVSNEAFAAGVASIPEPFSDAGWGGWFVWRPFTYRLEFSDATSMLLGSWDFEIDSKAMRKTGPGETMVLVAESQSGAFSISSQLRFLFKLN